MRADGYIPLTQEAIGHGIHYYNRLADEVSNLEQLDIQRPVGLNYDDKKPGSCFLRPHASKAGTNSRIHLQSFWLIQQTTSPSFF